MSPFLSTYLTPNATAVKFAIKTTLAMMLALYIALLFDLERPYWALISAAFLQIRPMSGMVVEKGICQLVGTFIGAVAGITIMALFAQARIPALIVLTGWIMLCTYVGSLWRNNYTYGCLMAAVTAMLIVVISSGSTPAGIFDIAVARLSELGLGAVCAMLVSSLLWPSHVGTHLATQADSVINEAFEHAALRLEASDDIPAMQKALRSSLGPLTLLETDSQAARFEGPVGPGRVRATHVLTRRTLRFFANLQALHQLMHDHADRLAQQSIELAGEVAKGFRDAEHVKGVVEARKALQALRHRVHESEEEASLAPLDRRLRLGLRESIGHAMIMLDAREAIASPASHKLRSSPLAWHRDHLAASINALRSGLLFSLLATFWIVTAWQSAMIAMMLGTLFSAFFASRDNPLAITMMFYKGMLAAIPSAFLFGHVLLSQANGFPMLAMLFGTPLFLGLLGATNPATMGYCLAFTIFNILLTMPGNGMDFSFDSFANRVVAVVIGLSAVVMGFRLLPGLGARLRRRRLIKAISRDIHELGRRSIRDAETRFSGHMADRLLQLAQHDDMLPEDQRHLFILGLTGLDLGTATLRLRDRLDDAPHPFIRDAHHHLLRTLAEGFEASANGRPPQGIREAGQQLDEAIKAYGDVPADRRVLLEGLIERLELALERLARIMANQPTRPRSPLKRLFPVDQP
ncbi:FUSC family protein [Halomonas sp. HAL1]|uniref:FUSC family protein n=1 Tax=Halomonas sp. HAL1 TaxID=550984 RepID=UPI00022D32E2|nr:FUSC family protein [Halomonas sp. HAL1]EHA15894.1 fusaric acid resistance protein [Halomonas sp. HAL1]WKV93836.1 FUSC family protein [Halomonas sp. HAL1]